MSQLQGRRRPRRHAGAVITLCSVLFAFSVKVLHSNIEIDTAHANAYLPSFRSAVPSTTTPGLTARAQKVPQPSVATTYNVKLVEESFEYAQDSATCNVGITRAGVGPLVLLLPALSSISTRQEVRGLQELLANSGFETVAVDWPGYGTTDKPRVEWTPENFEAFLERVLTDIAPFPSMVIAAGHAAGYILRIASKSPNAFDRAILVSPTWRGPVPTMLKGKRPGWLDQVRKLVDTPVVGQLFYKLNLNDFVIRLMARRHVYSQSDWLDTDAKRMNSKREVASAKGARHASIRFVTGGLDPYHSAEPFFDAAEALGSRVLVVVGGDMPGRSRKEVDELAKRLPRPVVVLPQGALGVHEEFPADVAQAIVAFAREQE